jgi:hypothetical protein
MPVAEDVRRSEDRVSRTALSDSSEIRRDPLPGHLSLGYSGPIQATSREKGILMRATRVSVLSVVSAFSVMASVGSAASPTSAAPVQARTGQYVLCYSDTQGSSFYLSGDFQIDVPLAPDAKSPNSDGGASRRALDALQKEFLEYLRADRGYRNSGAFATTCSGKSTIAELATMRDLLHQRFPQLKFVETGWKPGVKPTATPTPSATPSPVASPAMSANEKALAAQRPASNTAAKPSPSPARPAATPAVEVPATYSYCIAYGATPAGTTAQHFYISQPFKVSPGERLDQTFEKYLGSVHPGERISASCLSPGLLDAAQKSRQTTVDRRRKQPAQFDVIEVDWKR